MMHIYGSAVHSSWKPKWRIFALSCRKWLTAGIIFPVPFSHPIQINGIIIISSYLPGFLYHGTTITSPVMFSEWEKGKLFPMWAGFQLNHWSWDQRFLHRLYGGAEIAYGISLKNSDFFPEDHFQRVFPWKFIWRCNCEGAGTLYDFSLLYSFPKGTNSELSWSPTTGPDLTSNQTTWMSLISTSTCSSIKTTDESSLKGTGALATTLSLMVYTPWYLYGFRFSLLEQLQGGFVARQNSALFATRFYRGYERDLCL